MGNTRPFSSARKLPRLGLGGRFEPDGRKSVGNRSSTFVGRVLAVGPDMARLAWIFIVSRAVDHVVGRDHRRPVRHGGLIDHVRPGFPRLGAFRLHPSQEVKNNSCLLKLLYFSLVRLNILNFKILK